ncbi:MAG: glycosyltransferase family 4 protein [Cyclobacteriaceae bacterium]
MRILIVHQYFKTPEEGFGIRTYHIARALLAAGYEVCVVAGHNERNGKETVDGIPIQYFQIPYHNKFGILDRLKAFWSFVNQVKKYLKSDHEFDLAYVLTTPLTTGFIALFAKKRYSIPYAFEVGDLWPEVPIQLGIVKNGWLKSWLYSFEKRIYQNAQFLIALSPEIKTGMEYVIDFKKKALVAPNMSDCAFFKPTLFGDVSFNTDLPFQISYFGTAGYANHLEYLLDVAAFCEKQSAPIQFNIMADGSELAFIDRYSAKLTNINIVKPGGLASVKELLLRTQAVYISYLNVPILSTGSPNKLFDGLAAGKLIIINFEGWINELITKHECGFSHAPDDPEQLLERVIPFIQSPMMLEVYQENARKLAEHEFDKGIVTQRIIEHITDKS